MSSGKRMQPTIASFFAQKSGKSASPKVLEQGSSHAVNSAPVGSEKQPGSPRKLSGASKKASPTKQTSQKEASNKTKSVRIIEDESDSENLGANLPAEQPKKKPKTGVSESAPPAGNGTGDIPYALLSETFEKIEATTKRLQITAFLTEYFDQAITLGGAKGLLESVYLCLNRIGPEYEAKELGVGESLLIKVL